VENEGGSANVSHVRWGKSRKPVRRSGNNYARDVSVHEPAGAIPRTVVWNLQGNSVPERHTRCNKSWRVPACALREQVQR